MSLKQRIHDLPATGGDVVVPVLTAVNAASGVLPPLQAATDAALFILNEVKEFKENKEEWERFGEYVAGAVAAIDSYNASGEEATPWVENVTKLNQVLQRIQTEVGQLRGKMERRSSVRNFFSHLKSPSKIGDLEKDFNEVLALFQLGTDLIFGTIAGNQDRSIRGVDNSSVLDELKYPIVAHHDSTEACLEGTRTGLIERIMAWCRNAEDSEKRMLLLTAVAGAGKTSVAHSIVEECAREGILLLSFFFKVGEQSQPDHLFSGVARSLATHDPAYRSYIVSVIQKDPTLTTAPFTTQFKKLLAEPLCLKASLPNRPVVIVIDALDECEKQMVGHLADILWEQVPKLPSNIKFFVTSRRFDLVDRYLSRFFSVDRLSINLSDDANRRDCKIYIRAQLRKLKNERPRMKAAPKDENKLARDLLERAGGLFIWISAVFRYLRVASGASMKLLEELLDAGVDQPMASAGEVMDSVYTRILEKCNWGDAGFVHDYPIVMGAILIAQQPLSIAAWDAVLSPLLESNIQHTLAELAPLVLGVEHPDTPIRILHQSLWEFLVNRTNMQPPTLRHLVPDARKENTRLTLRCIEILNTSLSSMKNLELVEGLAEKAKLPPIPQETLSEQFRYACRHITYHLNQVQEPPKMLDRLVYSFLNQQLIHWVEVCVRTEGYSSISSFPRWAKLSVDQTSNEVIHALVKVLRDVHKNLAFFLRLQEAYEMANDSVALCRCLVSVDSESYTVDLAWSLGTLGTSLINLGRHSEALPVITESVEFWRELVAVHKTYTVELARALQNLGVLLGGLGQPSKALPVIEESVKLWRKLVAIHPASHTPDLARALQNLKISFDKLGRHSEALPVIDESVTLWRKLVAVNPTLYTPDLARSLGNLDTSLTNLGRHSEVLPVMKESVKLWRELVAVHPSSYTPDLAQALFNLNWTLDEFGRYSEALPVIEESVKLWRRLVAVHPTLYTPGLARALRNLHWSLRRIEQYSEALPVIEESVNLWRELVVIHPTLYTSNLTGALHNLEVLLEKLEWHSEVLLINEERLKLLRR